MTPGLGKPIGRRGSAYWTLGFCAVAGTLLLAGAFGVGTAHAAAPPAPADLGAQIDATVTTQVDAAIADSATVLSQAQQAVAEPTPDAGSPPPPTSDLGVGTVELASAPSTPALAPPAVVTVELASAPSTPALAPPAVVTPPVAAAAETTRARSALRALQHAVPGLPVSRSAMSTSAVRARAQLQAIVVVGTTVERATARATVQLGTAARSSPVRTHARPNPAPAPPRPFPPSAPGLPSSGTSPSSAQSSGQGALLTFLLATLGGLAVFGIPLLLRKVFWSHRRMPRLVAYPPWRPG